MKKNDLFESIKKERKEGKKFIKANRRGYYSMKFDKSDGEFWVDCFVDSNEYKRYKSDSIVTIRLDDVMSGDGYSEDEICEDVFRYCLTIVDKDALDDYPKTIGDYRERCGISRAEMSRIFEIPIRTLENWEAGTRIPPEWSEKLIIEKLERIREEKNN